METGRFWWPLMWSFSLKPTRLYTQKHTPAQNNHLLPQRAEMRWQDSGKDVKEHAEKTSSRNTLKLISIHNEPRWLTGNTTALWPTRVYICSFTFKEKKAMKQKWKCQRASETNSLHNSLTSVSRPESPSFSKERNLCSLSLSHPPLIQVILDLDLFTLPCSYNCLIAVHMARFGGELSRCALLQTGGCCGCCNSFHIHKRSVSWKWCDVMTHFPLLAPHQQPWLTLCRGLPDSVSHLADTDRNPALLPGACCGTAHSQGQHRGVELHQPSPGWYWLCELCGESKCFL